MMVGAAEPFLPPGWALRGCEAERGVAMITDEAGLPVAAEEVVRIGLLEASCVDGIVVAAFADPGASVLRARVSIPVVGIGEAALLEAGAGGRRFGVATTTPGLVTAIEARVRLLGLSAGFTGVRVPLGDPLSLAARPADQDAALGQAVQACLQRDGAEAVVIDGGPPQRERRTADRAVRRGDRAAAAGGDAAGLLRLGVDHLAKAGDFRREQCDQGRVPARARRRFLTEGIENAQQGGFQRGVARLRGMREDHNGRSRWLLSANVRLARRPPESDESPPPLRH